MLEIKEGCKVPFPEKLFEGYEARDTAIYANVNASKILDMMKHFIEMHKEPLFFILELPCKIEDGITAEKSIVNANEDYDVYFIDGLDAQQAQKCMGALGDFLVKDGMNTFGIGGHESQEEILFGKYNVMTIYTENAEAYFSFFNRFGIQKTDKLITAWDTFDAEHPGECIRYVSEETGKTMISPKHIKNTVCIYTKRERNMPKKPRKK